VAAQLAASQEGLNSVNKCVSKYILREHIMKIRTMKNYITNDDNSVEFSKNIKIVNKEKKK
jgi:hypothetical protein